MSILIVNEDVPDLEIIKNSLLENTHYLEDKCDENSVLSLINTQSDINRIGFMFHHKLTCFVPFFVDPLEKDLILTDPKKKPKYKFYSDRLITLFSEILKKNPNITFDILSCNFSDYEFMHETDAIENELKCTIEYSLDMTGNPTDGGNWILESNKINIQNFYFNQNISKWNHVLAVPANVYTGSSGTSGTSGTIQDFFTTYFDPSITITHDSMTNQYTLNPPSSTLTLKVDGSPSPVPNLFINGSQQAIIELMDGEVFSGNGVVLNMGSYTYTYYGLFIGSGLFRITNLTLSGLSGATMGTDSYGNICGCFVASSQATSISLYNCIVSGSIKGCGFIGDNCCSNNIITTNNIIEIDHCNINCNINGSITTTSGGFVGSNCCSYNQIDGYVNSITITNSNIVGDVNAIVGGLIDNIYSYQNGGGGFIGSYCCSNNGYISLDSIGLAVLTASITITSCCITGNVNVQINLTDTAFGAGGGLIGSNCCCSNICSGNVEIQISSSNITGNINAYYNGVYPDNSVHPDNGCGGGLIGYACCNNNTSSGSLIDINDCYISGNVHVGSTGNVVGNSGGGFIGYYSNSANRCTSKNVAITISSSHIYGTIYANSTNTASDSLSGGGGLVGNNCCFSNHCAQSSITITQSYITSNITSDTTAVTALSSSSYNSLNGGGGLIGFNSCSQNTCSGDSFIAILGSYIVGNIDVSSIGTTTAGSGGGGLVGSYCCYGNTSLNNYINIQNSYITGNTTANTNGPSEGDGAFSNAGGGLIGTCCCFDDLSNNNYISLSQCVITGNVNVNSQYCYGGGGLIGSSCSSQSHYGTININQCLINGNIMSSSTTNNLTNNCNGGGLIGGYCCYQNVNSGLTTITQSNIIGNITLLNNYGGGGFIGNYCNDGNPINSITITDSYIIGTITGTNCGVFVGTNCCNDNGITGNTLSIYKSYSRENTVNIANFIGNGSCLSGVLTISKCFKSYVTSPIYLNYLGNTLYI